MHYVSSRISTEQPPERTAFTRSQYDQIVVVADSLQGYGTIDATRTATFNEMKVMVAKIVPQRNDIVRQTLFSAFRTMKQRHLRMKRLCQGGQKPDPLFPVADQAS